MVTDGGILKVLYNDRIVLEGKKGSRGHYYMVESPCEVELRELGGVQNEVELQVQVDRTRDRRLERTRGDVAR